MMRYLFLPCRILNSQSCFSKCLAYDIPRLIPNSSSRSSVLAMRALDLASSESMNSSTGRLPEVDS